jgi:preprotein translocase subunit SecA
VFKLLTSIFGSRNQRLLRQYAKLVTAANGLDPRMRELVDADFPGVTAALRQRLNSGATLNEVLPEAFAAVREAARRTIGLRHFDVQLIGGIALHEGKIAEMRTGEGKTLVATLPVYLNALIGKGVHVVTVNDYLAGRDAEWMGPVYRFLGMSVGVIRSGQSQEEKRAAYACDITYGTNNEYGFDYLRDNLAFRQEERVQRTLQFAIVDEVDSILIDEARTPLIISGPAEESTELYLKINELVPRLVRAETEESTEGDYWVDEKQKQIHLTEPGHERVEELMASSGLLRDGGSLYDAANIRLMHHLNAALRAHLLYRKDVEYIVKKDEVVIVDEFTGRTMPGRRWSEGLHQAVEAKEGVKVREENQTIASITFQNYFRMYKKLGGMTGTADTEAYEFQEIYGLEVVVIPTHRPMIRKDMSDLVYLSQDDKFKAIIDDIRDCLARQQPVLVGTTSIETSELLSKALTKDAIVHQVLNAKQHDREAQIVAQAGRPGAVTIATNMAGRGTDIVLGGRPATEASDGVALNDAENTAEQESWRVRHAEVLAAGGLHIIGTERHESRRIDNQLRGRSGRQGDPGSSRFYLSLEDSLMRIFGDPTRMKALLSRVGMREGEAIESGMLTRQIERAQRKVEAYNFDLRKNLLEYDDVANDQRKVIYGQRNELMAADDIADTIVALRDEVVAGVVGQFVPPESVDEHWDVAGLEKTLESDFGFAVSLREWLDADRKRGPSDLVQHVNELITAAYQVKEASIGSADLRRIERTLMLQMVDGQWREHLAAMDYMRQGIFLRSYAQKNPKQEYKREAFELFSGMLERIKLDTVTMLSRMQIRSETELERQEQERKARLERMMQFQHAEPPPVAFGGASAGEAPVGEAVPEAVPLPFQRTQPKVGRNDVCPCGSGKKFKHCHGQLDANASVTALAPTTDIGRNDLCPCGSGRKYKHCHGAIE